MSETWLFRIGRLGFARADYLILGDARHLFWRFWWINKPSVLPPDVYTQPNLLVNVGRLHWSPDHSGLPMCGASTRERWTVDLTYVTCGECRRRGRMMQLQYDVNTR